MSLDVLNLSFFIVYSLQQFDAGVAQLVEHNLAKVGVAGSNPVARSMRQRKQ